MFFKSMIATAYYTFADSPEKEALRKVLYDHHQPSSGQVCVVIRQNTRSLCAPEITEQNSCDEFCANITGGVNSLMQSKTAPRNNYEIIVSGKN